MEELAKQEEGGVQSHQRAGWRGWKGGPGPAVEDNTTALRRLRDGG